MIRIINATVPSVTVRPVTASMDASGVSVYGKGYAEAVP
jgi:hypothetical protein